MYFQEFIRFDRCAWTASQNITLVRLRVVTHQECELPT